MKVGNPVCDQCLASHPPAFDCTTHFVAPDTPTVTPLDCQHSTEPTQYGDEVAQEMRDYYERHKRVRHSPGCADNLMLGLLNIAWSHAPKPALPPVEADDAGLIERVARAIAEVAAWDADEQWTEYDGEARAAIEACGIASLSAAKVEAEKEVEPPRWTSAVPMIRRGESWTKVHTNDDGTIGRDVTPEEADAIGAFRFHMLAPDSDAARGALKGRGR